MNLQDVETTALLDEIEARLDRIGIALSRREWWRPYLEAVIDIYDVGAEELVGRKRTATVARGRGIAMWLMRNHTTRSLAEIAAVFGRDHGTVIHWCRRIANARSCQPALWAEAMACERGLITRAQKEVAAALRRRAGRERGVLPPDVAQTQTR